MSSDVLWYHQRHPPAPAVVDTSHCQLMRGITGPPSTGTQEGHIESLLLNQKFESTELRVLTREVARVIRNQCTFEDKQTEAQQKRQLEACRASLDMLRASIIQQVLPSGAILDYSAYKSERR
eukprot:GHVO01044077.1.p1 GENE.GHVO01044077.1~~GHVO01044077.1.p1  ORF type:complete len:123 (+),score=19.83 GHVO01044077.1:31-399(+)